MRLLAASALTLASAAAFAGTANDAPTNAELYEIIQAQQSQLEALQGNNKGGMSATTLGGYGELHMNFVEGGDDKIDFHRFVAFINHEFNDKVRLFSEIELEHALAKDTDDGTGPGEVELEQAYIEVDLNDTFQARGGLFLIPVGFLNETHEPPTFYGVERNPVEKNIIPTTWWEAGAGATYRANGLQLDGAITSGLKTDTSFNIRSARQKVANAKFNSRAYTVRALYQGVPGLSLGATLQFQEDLLQARGGENASAILASFTAAWEKGPFSAKALYAQWKIDHSAAEAAGKDKQNGYYLEGAYKLCDELGVFARHNRYDNTAGDDGDSYILQQDIGVNYWIHENVVLKADAAQVHKSSSTTNNTYNLGVGYQF